MHSNMTSQMQCTELELELWRRRLHTALSVLKGGKSVTKYSTILQSKRAEQLLRSDLHDLLHRIVGVDQSSFYCLATRVGCVGPGKTSIERLPDSGYRRATE